MNDINKHAERNVCNTIPDMVEITGLVVGGAELRKEVLFCVFLTKEPVLRIHHVGEIGELAGNFFNFSTAGVT